MSNRSISQINPVVIKQTVVSWNLQVITGGHADYSCRLLLLSGWKGQNVPACVFVHHRPGHGEILHG